MMFAKRMFRGAAIFGALVLPPLYFVPWPERQPEIYLGFVGLALVFQIVFWIIGGDPVRYRALMLPAIAEKFVFGLPAVALWLQGRTDGAVAAFGAIDLVLGVGFALALRQTQKVAE